MFLTLLSLLSVEPAQTPHRFVFLGAGRFAQYADMASLQPEGPGGRIRVFQVVEPDFRAAGVAWWGGWSWWRFDCDASQVDRLDFASVAVGGAEGPSTSEGQPAYPAAPGGDAAELLAVACGTVEQKVVATTVEAAVRIGRAAMTED